MTQEHWSDWIDHDGSGCPVPVGTVVHRVFDRVVDFANEKDVRGCGMTEDIGPVVADELPSWEGSEECWLEKGLLCFPALILRYRIRQFSALTDLKALIEQPVEETV